MSDVEAAVRGLVDPVYETVQVRDEDGKVVGVQTSVQDPLLVQLEYAVTSATGKGGGGGSGDPCPINDAAFFELTRISREVAYWCTGLFRPSRDVSANLREWVATAPDDSRTPTLRGWAASIRELLDPPKRLQITSPCTVCGGDFYLNGDGEKVPHPVVVEYAGRDDVMGTVRAVCRADGCGAYWEGEMAVRALAFDLA